MGTKSFNAFVAKLQEDESLREEIRAAGTEDGIHVDDLSSIARAHGYEFTVDDVSEELDDAQLDSVAGGGAVIEEYSSPTLQYSATNPQYLKWSF